MKRRIAVLLSIFLVFTLACSAFDAVLGRNETVTTAPPLAASTPTPLIAAPSTVGDAGTDEPVLVTGTIPFTSPFFMDGIAEPFVLLEDQSGFLARDVTRSFALSGQAIGPVELVEDGLLQYSLSLPAVPQAVLHDVDQDGEEDRGVMVFAVAYWSNTWGGPFLEERDGTGWSTAYASTTTDPDRDNEINGGHLIIWAPDDAQSFPSGFGEDAMLFTEDDPIQDVPAGYSIVDLNTEPFRVYKEANPQMTLIEGEGAVNDYSAMTPGEAFDAMFAKVSVEYPFTADKNIDWQALYEKHAPIISAASSEDSLYRALRDFTYDIPDSHVGLTFNADVFYEEHGGSFGMVLAELVDGRVIVSTVFPYYAAAEAGIEPGAEILTWDGEPVQAALDAVDPYLGPYSTAHSRRQGQLLSLTRMPVGESVAVSFRNPGSAQETDFLLADVDYDSLFEALGYNAQDPIALPIEAKILDSGVGYIRINTFSDDYNLMARLWEKYIQVLLEYEVTDLVLDLRTNSGGSGGLAMDFAGYFFDQEITVAETLYYNALTGEFEANQYPSKIKPAPMLYEGEIAVLVSPDCVSACEWFTNAMTMEDRAVVVGSFPTNGAAGEVGRGQYTLPYEISMQFPTGRPQTMDGALLIEGVGVVPSVVVPVTAESVLGSADPVLDAAVEKLLR
ncbi:MAG: S41 family peptidase [Anaerolineaceae bacterium]|jgi:C-terminal processing protease CtpA/Prc|nr:S41 family peptidase [Anaerolineaceae bacterium]